MRDETYTCKVTARRKGRGQRPCTVKVGYTRNREVVLRGIDNNGVASIVALFNGETAMRLAKGLSDSANAVNRTPAKP
jgi:hypothetical protein